MRLASIDPRAPFAKRTSAIAASSTVTVPFFFGLSSSGRRLMKVSSAPATSVISPTRNRARSTEWEARSPSAPEPARFFCRRHSSGNFGSTIQSCR